jgi:L-alanine-DL-glutamate epimerase-like enolase superfamily enzyme
LWDLQGKVLDLPLYRLLGDREKRVLAYASCLGFHLTHTEVASLFQQTLQMGFKAFKVKVGHRDLTWDLTRLAHVVEVVGMGARLMIDANEAWSPKEAISRLHAYREAGFNIYWVEDPCLRDDFVGLAQVAQAAPFCRLNTG